jgi:hypothetical protein
MNAPGATSKISIINAVTKPLGFLVLAFLAFEALLGILVINRAANPEPLLWAMLAALAALIVVVVALAIWRPEALTGVRPLSAHYAVLFSGNLTMALEGPFANLGGVDQDEAWATLAGIIEAVDGGKIDREYVQFCKAVSELLRKRADAKARWKNARGPITA